MAGRAWILEVEATPGDTGYIASIGVAEGDGIEHVAAGGGASETEAIMRAALRLNAPANDWDKLVERRMRAELQIAEGAVTLGKAAVAHGCSEVEATKIVGDMREAVRVFRESCYAEVGA